MLAKQCHKVHRHLIPDTSDTGSVGPRTSVVCWHDVFRITMTTATAQCYADYVIRTVSFLVTMVLMRNNCTVSLPKLQLIKLCRLHMIFWELTLCQVLMPPTFRKSLLHQSSGHKMKGLLRGMLKRVPLFSDQTIIAPNAQLSWNYKGVSKSPRTMLITRKSLVVHEFPARVCCGGVLWVGVLSGVVGCGSVWLLHVSLCVYCISRLQFSDIGGMAEVDEQGVCIKFCVRLGKTGSETFEMLKQAFGDSCMSHSRTFEWFGRFKNGRTSTANDDRSGRLSTATTPSKVAQVQAAVNQDQKRR